MLKFERRYKIVFEIGYRRNLNEYIPQENIVVEYPFTLRLNVSCGVNAGNVSQANFQILNLSPQIQAKLWKDNFNQNKYITMWLYAGYQDVMPLIYKGDILQCYSYRDSGSTDYITELQSNDSGYLYQYGVSNYTFSGETKFENLLKTLLQDVPLYKLGYITPSIPPIKRDKTFIGQTMDLLGREYGGYQIYIDKGELNILGKNDVVPGNIAVLTAESGMLGSPRRAEQYLNVDMIFEPRLKLGQAIELISDSLPFVNNIYKIVAISHKGVISPVDSGALITSVTLYLGTAPFNELKRATEDVKSNETPGTWQKPVQGTITSPFMKNRKNPVTGKIQNHDGIDIGADMNTPIFAPANGKIMFCGWAGGYGNAIYIEHGIINGKLVVSRYGHLSKFIVRNGQTVTKGTQIGYVGSTGNSTGPHLHFEIRENNVPVDPQIYVGKY